MLRRVTLGVSILICIAQMPAGAQTYASEVRALLSNSRKIDFHKYQVLALPTTSFAIGTMYPLESRTRDFDLAKQGIYGDSNDWWTTLSTDYKAAALRAIFKPGEAGTIDLQGKHTGALGLEAVFPQVAAILSSQQPGAVAKISVVVRASTAQNRTIDWLEMGDAVYMEHLLTPEIVDHADKRDFVMTAGDIVLNGFEANLSVKDDEALRSRLGAALRLFVQQSRSDFELSENPDGSFNLRARRPVVAAVYLALPPSMPWEELGDRKLPPLATPALLAQIARVEQMVNASTTK